MDDSENRRKKRQGTHTRYGFTVEIDNGLEKNKTTNEIIYYPPRTCPEGTAFAEVPKVSRPFCVLKAVRLVQQGPAQRILRKGVQGGANPGPPNGVNANKVPSKLRPDSTQKTRLHLEHRWKGAGGEPLHLRNLQTQARTRPGYYTTRTYRTASPPKKYKKSNTH